MAVLSLVALGWFALYLAAMRIYQVDEACNVFVAAKLMSGQLEGPSDVYQVMLSWVLPAGGQSVELFNSARLLMVIVFWLNWLLMASATGERTLSTRWCVALLGAATLAPIWDYGFEVRHDNLLLAGVLTMWTALRFGPAKWQTFVFVGFCVVGLQFVAIKAVVYTVPLAFLALVFRSGGTVRLALKAAVASAGGGLRGYVLVRMVFHLGGAAEQSVAGDEVFSDLPSALHRFLPWSITLPRLLSQTPLLLALVSVGLLSFAFGLCRNARQALKWDGLFPEVALVAIALVALHINPNPYPYNLLHLVPYCFLLAYRYAALVAWPSLMQQRAILPIAIAVVVFAHFVPFGTQTKRHFERSNSRQEELMRLAERATDPAKDPVFDAIGMVPTRPAVDSRAFIHGQTLDKVVTGGGPQYRDMLAANPPAVVIPNYRTDWLPEADQEYIRSNYVTVADDFLVLGTVLPPGGGAVRILKEGRYRISRLEDSDLAGTFPEGLAGALSESKSEPVPGTFDGAPVSIHPVELAPGAYELKTDPDCAVAVVWVGPQMERLQRQSKGDHARLFWNWY